MLMSGTFSRVASWWSWEMGIVLRPYTYVGLSLTLDMKVRLENLVQNFASGYVDHFPFWYCMPVVKNAYPCFSALNGIIFCWVSSKCNNIDATIQGEIYNMQFLSLWIVHQYFKSPSFSRH
jgi:hypothetical protein